MFHLPPHRSKGSPLRLTHTRLTHTSAKKAVFFFFLIEALILFAVFMAVVLVYVSYLVFSAFVVSDF